MAVIENGELTLHLRLHINAPARLHALRWESLRDPRTGYPIATRSNVLLSRYLSSADCRCRAERPRGLSSWGTKPCAGARRRGGRAGASRARGLL
jgi:hypothetical protein